MKSYIETHGSTASVEENVQDRTTGIIYSSRNESFVV